ncbi:phosphate starvation-inducible protein PhoH [Alkalilimnicola ehrlichii]|uniref:Phosphate starvation-inducible protein PhoH n=1 Tax=Alkalilimnicola ehrlichii TaxID=351052 RepID=A0A3E0WH29_9GAMM|nr:PhoH family protein [Alkalilimnicola ehrlichii]RFA24811.1 phosphate starvation-inducible protein PhoH [Alkalilimnicola ehrlichii]RFA32068.1 phosphate starvation-inducible protein PhoH [Alkalilimnicola ehrlichii]
MTKAAAQRTRFFVVDASVLIHDPAALFRFQEHDLHLPMVVLEQLDHAKQGLSEEARNVRQVSRFLDQLLADAGPLDLERGLPLGQEAAGRLFFDLTPGARSVLDTALDLQEKRPDAKVTLVSKDINLRIRATVLGIHAEDYHSDQVLDDLDLLYSGLNVIPADCWRKAQPYNDGFRLPNDENWHLNQCLYTEDDSFHGIVREVNPDGTAIVSSVEDFRRSEAAVWGVQARNREQNFALNLLLDPNIDFVSLLGPAGTGKTLLTLAAGLAQTLDHRRFREIIMTRATISLGEDIGYLPGTEEEKMGPWMGALMDNLEVLTQTEGSSSWGRAATQDLLQSRVKVRSLNFMRGRTFLSRYIILDEAQNLTAKQMKALITRAGPSTKVVCMGNLSQIDTPYLTETSSGLTYVVDRFKGWRHGGHITLQRGERSRLADHATETL